MSDCHIESEAPAKAAPIPGNAPAASSSGASDPAGRMIYIDNLRWVMIVLVVLLHLWVTYGPVGSWYYNENKGPGSRLDLPTTLLFFFLCSVTQAYFMGLLFLIAGYFVPGALAAKGARRFMRDRCRRLGLPALFFMLALNPLIEVVRQRFLGQGVLRTLAGYPRYLYTLHFVGYSGPLWFAVALLVFSWCASLWPVVAAPEEGLPPLAPRRVNRAAAALVAAIFAGAFLVRLAQPIGTSSVNMQLCFFPQYIILFIVGMRAWRLDLLRRIPCGVGLGWLKAALFAGIPLWCVMGLAGGTDFAPYAGGWHWQAAAYALWEAFFCVGACLGLIVLFRERCNRQGALGGFLSRNAFAVYVTHAPVLVAGSMAVRGVALHPALKCAAVSAVLLPASFGVGWACRKLPLLGRIL